MLMQMIQHSSWTDWLKYVGSFSGLRFFSHQKKITFVMVILSQPSCDCTFLSELAKVEWLNIPNFGPEYSECSSCKMKDNALFKR